MIYISNIKSQLHSLEIEEHFEIANQDYLEQLNNILFTFHKYLRNENLAKNFENENNKNLETDETKKNNSKKNIFEEKQEVLYKIINELEFSLEVKESKLENPDIENGVFIRTKNYKTIKKGTLIGFVPGVYYENKLFNINKKEIQRPIEKRFYINHILKYPNEIYSLEKNENEKIYMKGEDLNFLAQGHKINHPGVLNEINTIFVDIEIPLNFFPKSYFNYIPNFNENIIENDFYHCMGILTIKDLEDNEELFLDYNEIFDLDKNNIPDWICKIKNPLGKFYLKKSLESFTPFYVKYVENFFEDKEILEKKNIDKILFKEIENVKQKEKSDIKKLEKEKNDDKLIN